MAVTVGQRRRMKRRTFGLPKKRKYPINTKRRAISAVAYAKKNAKQGNITAKERDKILRKVHRKFPSINIKPTRGFRM